jgi:hypothetical protein
LEKEKTVAAVICADKIQKKKKEEDLPTRKPNNIVQTKVSLKARDALPSKGEK